MDGSFKYICCTSAEQRLAMHLGSEGALCSEIITAGIMCCCNLDIGSYAMHNLFFTVITSEK